MGMSTGITQLTLMYRMIGAVLAQRNVSGSQANMDILRSVLQKLGQHHAIQTPAKMEQPALIKMLTDLRQLTFACALLVLRVHSVK